ncbi:LytR/AlgR family response regulator transcription factor [Chryseolinea lacunae]|uniref:Response regulator transcription factor n=1 Tax=Chryseolinea lacunae TaxID=2801331 RepID=A0ABS1KR90_9BACT|nr:LytTR family DNA-binding domain-containing protein [Chryseolinea lacunae]MBL0741993.1 response regulator transcription factor [Chryseolinea lacunae]
MAYEVLILEDEPHQEEFLKGMLSQFAPEFTVVATAGSIDEGRRLLERHQPDLVFMDVLMPPHTSFDLLYTLTHIPFEVIFTTSYEEFAVKAFRLSAVDYLVKPFARQDLLEALHKFKQRRLSREASLNLQALLENARAPRADQAKIALPTLTGFIFVSVKDIIRCESDNTYTTFHTTENRKIVVSKTLKECEKLLTDYHFFRVHNCHLINVAHIAEYVKGEGGILIMSDHSTIDVSRRRKDEFLKLLKKV